LTEAAAASEAVSADGLLGWIERGEAERAADPEIAVLGAGLLDGDALAAARAVGLVAEDFAPPGHNGEIFGAMCALADRREPIDPATLAAELKVRGKLNTVGGPAYLGGLTDVIPTIAHVEAHARIIVDRARTRRAVQAARAVVVLGESGASPSEVEAAAAKVAEASRRATAGDGLLPLSGAVEESFDRATTAREKPGETGGLRSGFRDLDYLLGGLRKKKVYLFGARSGKGKTALLLNIIRVLATQEPGALFEMEMPREELADRMLCADASVDGERLRDGLLDERDIARMVKAAGRLHDLPIYVDDNAVQTLASIESAALALKKKVGLGWLALDYVQLIKPEGRHGSEEAALASVSRGLKAMSKRLDVPVIGLAQLNRESEKGDRGARDEDREPRMSDLRGSGQLEQDADVIAFIKRSDESEYAEIVVVKHRGGSCGRVQLVYRKGFTRFESMASGPKEVN